MFTNTFSRWFMLVPKQLRLFCIFSLILPQIATAQFSLSNGKAYREGYAVFYDLKKNGRYYGDAILLHRQKSNKRIKAKYFASGTPYSKYVSWKTNKDIILVSSGAYSSSAEDYRPPKPIGLCVDNGQVVNRAIKSDMDGMVIVESVGGIRVSDIDECDLTLVSKNKTICPREEKNVLIQWGQEELATIFQTHLLAFKDELRIGTNSNQSSSRRRLLMAGYQNGLLIHSIFYIKNQLTLYDAAVEAKKTMDDLGISVVFMLNLDTGYYDILQAYDDYGREIPDIQGEKSVSIATNLLVYYYD